jgi:hypothetical protein
VLWCFDVCLLAAEHERSGENPWVLIHPNMIWT